MERVTDTKPRDRILSAARELFRRHGIRGIGVDAIAGLANTNKMTLYRHFGSKDELVVECLREIADETNTLWDSLESENPGDPLAKLKAWLRQAGALGGTDGRGCSIANAAIELAGENQPARNLIAGFKLEQRDRLAKLCRDAGAVAADILADTLTLMLEGAQVSSQAIGLGGPSSNFVATGEAVIASFVGRNGKRPVTTAKRRS